jgi:hypothetical protein
MVSELVFMLTNSIFRVLLFNPKLLLAKLVIFLSIWDIDVVASPNFSAGG